MRRLMVAIAAAIASALILGVAFVGAESPTVTIENASSVSYTSAKAKGTVDPKGKETFCHFEYVSQAQLEENLTNGGGEFDNAGGADCSGNPHNGSGPPAQDVEANLTGLSPSTIYHLRLVANNEDGQSEAVAASTFETDPVGKPTVTIDPVTTFTGTTAHFSGSINPNAPGSDPFFKLNWHFECNPGCPGTEGPALGTGNTPQAVQADATGLEPNTDYEVKLIAESPGGTESAGPVSFKTAAVGPEAQTIPAFALAGGTSALLGGRVNPHNTATVWWVEYGTTTGYGKSEPASKDAAAGAGGQEKVVTQEITGLTPGTTYHYRVVAKSSAGETPGEDVTFTTSSTPQQPAPGSCSNEQFRVGPSAALPDCRAYELASPPDLGGSSVSSAGIEGARGWSQVASDGNSVVWNTDATRPGFPNANGGHDLYVSRRSADGWTDEFVGLPGNSVRGTAYLFWATPDLERFFFLTWGATLPGDDGPENPSVGLIQDYYREEPDGTFAHINQGSDPEPVTAEVPFFYGITPDGMKVLFGDNRHLEPDAQSGSIYLRSGNTTEIVSRDENNALVEGAGVLSEDGSTVAFTSFDGSALWVRDLAAGHSTLVASDQSGNQLGISALSANGRRLIISTPTHLTPDDQDPETLAGIDLFEFDLGTETFTRLSAATGSPATSGNATVCGNGDCASRFLTMTKDGTRIYFVSSELLDGEKGIEGSRNLYLHEGGQTTYVTTLDPGDKALDGEFRLTPDGSTLLFESASRITAYDSGGHDEIYAYDSNIGRTACVSCRPDGTAPSGEAGLREGPGEKFTGYLNLVNSDANGLHYYFHTSDPLVAADTNDRYDVYEYDVASATPLLISDGKSDSDTAFWGNSLDGRDIFMASSQPLTSEDRSVSAVKVYDARIGGGFPTPVKPPPCEGEGCRGQGGAPPTPIAPLTSSFEGPPNPKPNHKGKKHKKKHRKHRAHGKKKSHAHRRAANSNGRTGR